MKTKFYEKPICGSLMFIFFGLISLLAVIFPNISIPKIGINTLVSYLVDTIGIAPIAICIATICFILSIVVYNENSKTKGISL